MKKYIYLTVLFLFGIVLISCSGDDDSASATPPIPADQKYLSKVTNEQGEIFAEVKYNDDKTIEKMTIAGFIFRYEYNQNGEVSNLHMAVPGEPLRSFSYTYDANGTMNAYTDPDGEVHPMVYNAQENSYHFVEDEFDSYTVFLNTNQTFKKIIEHDQGQNDTTINLFYEDEKYGALHNANNVDLPTMVAFPVFYYAYWTSFNMGSVPFQEVFGGEVYISHENEFEQDNFLKNSIVTSPLLSNQPIKFKYEYIQL